jgi:hypothetical protein
MVMRKAAIVTLALSIGIIGWASTSFALIIMDDYIGGDPTRNYPHVDVIGAGYLFDVDRLEVNILGDQFVVDIFSDYFDNVGRYDTALGDLFLSIDGWKGVTPSDQDSMHNGGEDWELVLALDHHDFDVNDAKFGDASLYGLNPADAAQYEINIITSDERIDGSRYIYRGDQEVQYNAATGQGTLLSSGGSWSIYDGVGEDFLRISIAATAAGVYDISDIYALGYHYTMTCGNDVIEGAAPVPEPGTVFLLGAGLFGLAAAGRKRLLGSR